MAKQETAGIGHNSGETSVGGVAGQRLKSLIERIERLEEEKRGLGDDIKDVYAEAKGVGFDAPTIRRIVKARRKDKQKYQEQEELFDLYSSALGGIFG